MPQLTKQERAVLDFESRIAGTADGTGGARVSAINNELGLTEVRYYQLLARLLGRPEALAYRPVLLHRLERLRAARQARVRARPAARVC